MQGIRLGDCPNGTGEQHQRVASAYQQAGGTVDPSREGDRRWVCGSTGERRVKRRTSGRAAVGAMDSGPGSVQLVNSTRRAARGEYDGVIGLDLLDLLYRCPGRGGWRGRGVKT